MTDPFLINGRFLAHDRTGVQRYAFNVSKFISATLNNPEHVAFIAPKGTADPHLDNIPLIEAGYLSGHAWEQFELPFHRRGRLLNLCNSAPLVVHDQIVCIHDANVYTAAQSYSALFRNLYKILHPKLARRSLRVTTVSHSSARQLARHLPLQLDEITVLPNGHEHVFEWDASLATKAPDIVASIVERGRSFILLLGSRAHHKNLKLLIDLAPALHESGIDVVVAGGDAAIFNRIEIGKNTNVHALGRVSDHDLCYLMQNALCLAFPSFTEGFGLPLVEAMALGCPVISSNLASMPEVCGHAALFASPFEGSEWLAQIQRLKQSSSLQNELKERGVDQAKKFSWASTAQGYLDLLENPEVRRVFWPTPPSLPAKVAVVVATRGRPDVVSATVRHLLATQTVHPHDVIISCVEASDAGDLIDDPRVRLLTGPPGLAAQRNRAISNLQEGTEIVIFFDDDFVADKDWIHAAVETFRDENRAVSFTGHVIADGIKGPGIVFEDAVNLVNKQASVQKVWNEGYSPYGCNMAFRLSAIRGLSFDERLVLYGWLEDRDFAARVAKKGGILVQSSAAKGVHMGVKGGRVSGGRLGYSQIVNPIYMFNKGSMTAAQVFGQISRNILSNVFKAVSPEPFIDRRGRVRGNLRGIMDVLRGRLEPERAASIDFTAKAKMHQREGKTR